MNRIQPPGLGVVAHPLRQVGIVEVVVLHERDCGLGRFYVVGLVGDLDYLVVVDAVHCLVVLAYHYVGAEHHGEAYYESETYLTYDLEFTFHPLLVLALHFDVVVEEAESAEPQG